MYIPKHNEEKRVPVMQALIEAEPFAALITMGVTGGSSGLVASHIPMVLEQDGSPFGVLKGHVARANTQWRDFTPAVDALAIFAGHHHYVSASWYPAVSGDGAPLTNAEVPTWNYVVVHAYGPLQAIEDPRWLLAHLTSLTEIHEGEFNGRWSVDAAPDGFIDQQMRGIVGLELPIRRLEGKWKVSQNRNDRDRRAVIDGLARLGTAESLAMKKLVAREDD